MIYVVRIDSLSINEVRYFTDKYLIVVYILWLLESKLFISYKHKLTEFIQQVEQIDSNFSVLINEEDVVVRITKEPIDSIY